MNVSHTDDDEDDPIKQESTSEESDGEFTQYNNLSAPQATTVSVQLSRKSTVFTHSKTQQKKTDVSESSWTVFTHIESMSPIVKKYTKFTTNIFPSTDTTTPIHNIDSDDDEPMDKNDIAPINNVNSDDDDDDDDKPLSKCYVKLHPNASLSSLVGKQYNNGFKTQKFKTQKQQNQLIRNREKIKELQEEYKRLQQRNMELKTMIKSI